VTAPGAGTLGPGTLGPGTLGPGAVALAAGVALGPRGTGAAGPGGPLTSTVTSTTEPVQPEPVEGVDPSDVSPGLLGFLVTFAVVLACIPLFLSMTRKLRGVSRRSASEDGGEQRPHLPDEGTRGTEPDAPGPRTGRG
jgi:hypothetical protein